MFNPPKLKETFKTLENIIYTLYPALKTIDFSSFKYTPMYFILQFLLQSLYF